MTGSEHADEALRRVLAARPWLDPVEDNIHFAGRGRYARAFKYAARVNLQILYTKASRLTPESLEVALAFDDGDRAVNVAAVEEYRAQLGVNEATLALRLRDGQNGVNHYLGRFIPLAPSAAAAHGEAAELCAQLIDLALGGANVSAGIRARRDRHARGPAGAS